MKTALINIARAIAVALIIIAGSGCAGDSPTAPTPAGPTYDQTTIGWGTTWAQLEASDIWEGYINYDGTGYQDAAGNWNYEPVSVSVVFGFDPERVHSISSSAPIGCDLVYVNGYAVGDPDAPNAVVENGRVDRQEVQR